MTPLAELLRIFFSFLLAIMLLVVISYIFCIWMLIHAIKNENILWIIILAASLFSIFLPWLAGLIYFFAVYRKTEKHTHR